MRTETLSQYDLFRYGRHFPVIGLDGQKKLKAAKVLCIGAGGLGAPALQYLVAAGVGQVGIVDGDCVDMSNLQRQVLFHESQIGQPKVIAMAEVLKQQNSHCKINCYPHHLNVENAEKIIQKYDIILDATDNFRARYLINRACVRLNKPLVFASVFQFDAQITVFNYKQGPCYECLYPSPPPPGFIPNCAQGGVLGVLPGIAGLHQACEIIKIILNKGDILSGTILSFDLLSLQFTRLEVQKNPHCACCNTEFKQLLPESIHHHEKATHNMTVPEIDAKTLATWRNEDQPDLQILDVREPFEREICSITPSTAIPLATLPDRYLELDADKPCVVFCKSGGRSLTAANFLMEHGFKRVYNLADGIIGWVQEIEPEQALY